MQIKVYNNNVLVHHGTLTDFLSDNQNDEYLTDLCKQLETESQIEFVEVSGTWIIERV